jgi:hypothetical protein
MVFDGSLNQRNLLIKLSAYEQVLDEPNSLTCLPDLLSAAEQLIRARSTGIFNVVNPGIRSPLEIVGQYQRQVCPTHLFRKLPDGDLRQVARTGRSSCVLSIAKLQSCGIKMRDVSEALDEAFAALRRHRESQLVASTDGSMGPSSAVQTALS